MTERLYYNDCYLANFESAVIESADDGRRIYLGRTAFYPTSGGQPNDLGDLSGRRVIDVVDEGERIAHLLDAPLKQDQQGPVEGRVEWSRRYDHMQQHTGQHLLSAVWVELFGIPTVSFHMGPEVSTVELKTKELSDSQIDQVEARINEIAREGRSVTISFENAAEVEGLRKPSARSGALRIVMIDGLDKSACGGTHTRSVAETGPVQMRKWEKLRGNVRIEFVCGDRATKRSKQDFRILWELSRAAAAGIEQLPETIAGVRKRLAEVEKERQALSSELAIAAGTTQYQQTAESGDGIRRVFERVNVIDEASRAKAQAFARQGKAVALFAGSDPPGVLVAVSPGSGFNAGAILKTALSQFGARGGGSETLAQGSCPDPNVVTSLRTALGFEN